MERFSSALLLKQKAIQKQIGAGKRYIFDSSYRHFLNDFNHLEKLLDNPMQAEEDIEPEKLKGWTPIRLHLSQTSQMVAWLDLGQTSFTDAFSYYTVCRSWQNQNRPQPVWTKLDVLTSLQNVSPGLRPKGFIFNIAKCGSTLLSKMLCSLPRNLVISENPVIDMSLNANVYMIDNGRFSDSFRIELFQSAVNALGQPRLRVEENYLIRFSPTRIFNMPFIKKVFPEVPSVFLYRHPVEVGVSNLIEDYDYKKMFKKSSYFVKKMLNLSAIELSRTSPEYSEAVKQILDYTARDIVRISKEELEARCLGAYFQIALHQLDKNTLLINYNQLQSESGLRQVLDFFQSEVSDAEIATMTEKLRYYSKEDIRKQAYRDDRADKQKMASKKIRDLVDKWAMEPYMKLEKKRQEALENTTLQQQR